jgi:hypothetical protein
MSIIAIYLRDAYNGGVRAAKEEFTMKRRKILYGRSKAADRAMRATLHDLKAEHRIKAAQEAQAPGTTFQQDGGPCCPGCIYCAREREYDARAGGYRMRNSA